ncbi:nucleotidyltransferase domain-containing protein [Candidatus Woesearchaeota archaeon]|nr:nucleotidyltransferase domain-containing protein [Candidatus Woesearchaeota archaeon]
MESKRSYSLKELKEDLSRLLRKYKDVEDFYIFGSFVKGKFKPADIDVGMIVHKKDYPLLAKVVKDLKGLHVEMFMFKEMFTEPIWKSFLSEGYSVRRGGFLRDLMKIESYVLFQYSLKSLNRSEKTMFNRGFTLKLRGVRGKPIAPGAVMIPVEHENAFDEFLEVWDKVKVKKKRVLVL